MTREEQLRNRELKKRLPQEIRKWNKKYKIHYSYEFLYKFEGDFLYIGMPSVGSDCLYNAVMITPWVLDEIYWKVQKMNMEEMLSQPKSFHVRGVFTVDSIYYKSAFSKYQVTTDNFEEMIKAFREDRSALIREVKSMREEVDEQKDENSKLVNIIIGKKWYFMY